MVTPMERIAVFPGSFDPVTRGHESIIQRALPLFDRIIVAIGENNEKRSLFPIEKRLGWLRSIFADEPRISAETYQGLTIDFCRKVGSRIILRGLRTSADFEFERGIAQINKQMYPDLETVFILCNPEFSSLSSSIVRDIYRNQGDVSRFIPEGLTL